ncbi:putative chromatin regulator PHD family [Helianthus annuus]|nr:putative chromatin regulator PHD family [Helianthus annuus]KAJ0865195.1 putative chromatin regulator PHD family [Helianthus annuus]
MDTCNMVVLQHKHSLSLIDLNPKYPHDEQVYDDEEDLIIKQAFRCPCARCEQEITYLHRYYYKCDQCDYSLHKLCKNFPTTLQHVSHSAHSLALFLDESLGQCHMCKSTPRNMQLRYGCSRCMFSICLDCAIGDVQYHTIYHPSHQHPLIPFCKHKQVSAECDACGKEHRGVFYECSTCFRFSAHNDCVFQPKRLLIQDGTENFWVYKCEKCRYYAHADCANSIWEPSNSIFTYMEQIIDSRLGTGEDVDYPLDDLTFEQYKDMKDRYHVLDFPLPDLSCCIFTDLLSKTNYEMSITHNSHEHPLVLVDSQCNNITLYYYECRACRTPIIAMPFYECTKCRFRLHEWCTRVPTELKGHPSCRYDERSYLQHTIIFMPEVHERPAPCSVCYYSCYRFAYRCVTCDCYIHVWCALAPTFITHKSHPYHLFHRLHDKWLNKGYCRVCLSDFTDPRETSYTCMLCDFHLHMECALLLPETTRHRYDKHPMTLCYSPVEDHIGDYFCEVCEEEINPNGAFYHCHECLQSMHTACAPLVPHIHGLHAEGVAVELDKYFIDRCKKVAVMAANLSQTPSSSMAPQGSTSSTSS